jgi:hypothetical protein
MPARNRRMEQERRRAMNRSKEEERVRMRERVCDMCVFIALSRSEENH